MTAAVHTAAQTPPSALRQAGEGARTAALAALAQRLGERVSVAPAVCAQHANTTTWVANEPPDAVAFPQSTEDVQAIVRVCALLWQRGLVAGSSGNVSFRLAGGALLVTPTLRALRDLRPEEIVRLGPDGADPSGAATSELPLHLAAYRVRADIACVVHTHPPYATGWSKTSCP